MRLKIQRVGGMLPALRPSVVHELATLTPAQAGALQPWLAQAGRVGKAAHPEAMSYVFTLEADAGANVQPPLKISAAYSEIPEVLRELLPAAASTRAPSARR